MGLITESKYLGAILDNAPGNPLIWARFLSELTLRLNCDSCALLVTDIVERENTHFLYSAFIPQNFQSEYESGLNKIDNFNYYISKNPKQALSNARLMPSYNSQGNNRALFDESCLRFGLSIPCTQNHSLNLLLSSESILHNEQQQKIIEVLQSLLPALELAMHAEQRHKISSQLIHYIDDYFDGYIIVDKKLKILFSDPTYTSIISQIENVKISGNQFGMKNPIIEQRLLTLIDSNQVVETLIHNQQHSCQITLIPISTLKNLYQWECCTDGFILTFTYDKEKNPTIDRLTDIYHLSKCEAVCALHFMKTASIPDVATNIYRSQATVRNHIKHTMQKMDVHNQAELMKKLLTLATL